MEDQELQIEVHDTGKVKQAATLRRWNHGILSAAAAVSRWSGLLCSKPPRTSNLACDSIFLGNSACKRPLSRQYSSRILLTSSVVSACCNPDHSMRPLSPTTCSNPLRPWASDPQPKKEMPVPARSSAMMQPCPHVSIRSS